MTVFLAAAFVIICILCWSLALVRMLTLARFAPRPLEPVQVPRCFGCGHFCAASEPRCATCREDLE